MLFLNTPGKTGMGKNKGMDLVGVFFWFYLLSEAELHISAHDSEEYGEISW